MIVTMIGTSSCAISKMLRPMASDWFALLGADPGISARRVDEGKQRQAELLGELHQPERLAVALGPRHAEVARAALLGVAPFWWPSTMHGRPLKRASPPTMDRSSA